jgi:hypothetical protein
MPPIMGAFTCFLFMDLTGQGKELTTPKIIATLQLMVVLKILVFNFAMGIGFYFELEVILQRFCDVMNIQDKRMIQIDVEKKEIKENSNKINNLVEKGEIVFSNFNGYWKIS